ncbi:MAG: hypothetical protein ACI4W2_03040 [Eubacterium sp.]
MYRGYDNEATWAYAAYLRNDLKAYRKYRVVVRNLRLRYGEENLLKEFTKVLIFQKDRFSSQEKNENPYLKRIHEEDWEKIDYPAVAAAFIGQQE